MRERVSKLVRNFPQSFYVVVMNDHDDDGNMVSCLCVCYASFSFILYDNGGRYLLFAPPLGDIFYFLFFAKIPWVTL